MATGEEDLAFRNEVNESVTEMLKDSEYVGYIKSMLNELCSTLDYYERAPDAADFVLDYRRCEHKIKVCRQALALYDEIKIKLK